MAMARREVLVQLDDDLVTELDRIAEAQSTSRSELLRRGARAVIEAEEAAAADAELIAAYRRQPPDPALTQSAARLATRTLDRRQRGIAHCNYPGSRRLTARNSAST